jgi:cytosine/creatinine deaminase
VPVFSRQPEVPGSRYHQSRPVASNLSVDWLTNESSLGSNSHELLWRAQPEAPLTSLRMLTTSAKSTAEPKAKLPVRRTVSTPYFDSLERKITGLGGFVNAHLHLDRAGTYDDTVSLLRSTDIRDGTALSLAEKHSLIPMVHASPLYEPSTLESRVSYYLDRMVAVGTRRAETVVDVTSDRVGQSALERMLILKDRYSDRIDLRVGAYSPLGFRDDDPARWELIEAAAERADLIGLLPERDDRTNYPNHIGFEESCRRGISLAFRLNKAIQIHVDQANHCHESGGETVLDLVRRLEAGGAPNTEPLVWLIHLISPSTYDEARFERLAQGLSEQRIGVICCPSAAISMRQYRPFLSPTHNCIARVLDLLAAGVQVRIASDNICDITSPMGTADLMDEIFVLANALRFYDQDILAKVAAAHPLSTADFARLRAHLDEDRSALAAAMDRHSTATVRPG